MAGISSMLAEALRDRYTVERELGRGGMAIVYLAHDRRHDRLVALKTLRPELLPALGPDRFLREIQIAARLQHPHILPLFDSGEAAGQLWYTMPYVEGESLRQRLDREGQLSLAEALRISLNVLAALAYAHQHGIVHRDLKPENILLEAGEAVVADFGIAHAVDAAGGERLTETGLALGTPTYMSPEQASGRGRVDGRSDIYSLGCVLYEILTGEPPFSGTTPLAVIARHAVDPVPPVHTLRSTVPYDIERAVVRALAKVPADRFATAAQFAEVLAHATPVEPRAKEARRMRQPSPRRKVAFAGAAAAVLVAAGWGVWTVTGGGSPSIERLAVLPLANLMNDPGQEYFVQGMHDAVISELAQAGVPVIARTSVLRYRDTERTVREIARELGVDAVIEGSVLRAGDSVRIQAQLIDGNTEEHLWAQTYEGDLRDVLSLHRQVTRGIARQIRLALTPQAETRLASPRPVNPEAYEAYLKGRYHWNRRTEEGLRKGADYFRQAIEKDPASALGYTGLADCLLGLGWYGFLPPGESVLKAKAAALKALEIDEALAEAHNSLAYSVLLADWDWARSEREFKRALELNPRYPTAHHWYADYLSAMGRHEEAIASAQRAHGLDPLSLIINAWVGWRYYLARRYDEAIEHYQRTLELDSTFVPTYLFLGMAYQRTGRHAEGLNQLRKAVSLSGGSSVYLAALARGYAAAGNSVRTARLLHELNRLSKERYVSAYWIAQSYGAMGDKERAFQWLDKAYRERSTWLPYLNVDPTLDSLRPDPRFSALLRKVRLAGHEPE